MNEVTGRVNTQFNKVDYFFKLRNTNEVLIKNNERLSVVFGYALVSIALTEITLVALLLTPFVKLEYNFEGAYCSAIFSTPLK
jgi:hypothetical protein